MATKGDGLLFQEVDVLEVIKIIGTRKDVSIAKILQHLEQVIDDPQDYQETRRIILDEINDLARALVKTTLGNVEYLIK